MLLCPEQSASCEELLKAMAVALVCETTHRDDSSFKATKQEFNKQASSSNFTKAWWLYDTFLFLHAASMSSVELAGLFKPDRDRERERLTEVAKMLLYH